MDATGLAGPIRIVVPGWSDPPHAFVEFRGNGYGSTTGIGPGAGTDPAWALVTVADEAQDSIMETLWEAWPVCPIHHLGTHAREQDGAAVWRCSGGDGHTVAPIGHWDQART